MSWVERAKVGDKVVCVNDDPSAGPRIPGVLYNNNSGGLTYGVIYTIRGISICQLHCCPLIFLSEIVRDGESFPEIGGFWFERFEPVHNTSRQVEALKRLCLQSPEAVE
jgi:hypothetical protein